jgi:hypothetical protein
MKSKLPWALSGSDFSQSGWHTEPTAAYQLMFEFLVLSPSYELARKARADKLTKEESENLPKDFDKVLATYDLLGNVNCILFRQWWLKRGLHVFGNPYNKPKIHEIALIENREATEVEKISQTLKSSYVEARQAEGLSAALIVSIPLGLKRTEILKKFRSLLDAHISKDVGKAEQPKIKLMGKRLHINAMVKGIRLLWFKAAKPNWELWRLGAKAQLSDSYSKVLDPVAPRKAKDIIEMNDRLTMSKITFRAVHRFEHIAENAARGRFPCADPVYMSEFNYLEIAQRLLKHTKWG